MQKNSKNHENRKNSFFLETTSNTLIYVSNNISDVFDKFQVKIFQKITWSIFAKISDTGSTKKFKNDKNWQIFFSLETT